MNKLLLCLLVVFLPTRPIQPDELRKQILGLAFTIYHKTATPGINDPIMKIDMLSGVTTQGYILNLQEDYLVLHTPLGRLTICNAEREMRIRLMFSQTNLRYKEKDPGTYRIIGLDGIDYPKPEKSKL